MRDWNICIMCGEKKPGVGIVRRRIGERDFNVHNLASCARKFNSVWGDVAEKKAHVDSNMKRAFTRSVDRCVAAISEHDAGLVEKEFVSAAKAIASTANARREISQRIQTDAKTFFMFIAKQFSTVFHENGTVEIIKAQ